MATSIDNISAMMTAVPSRLRRRIVTGIRWTFWLSVLGVPFSYGINVVLARMGPEVIGTFGVLMVYIGFVSSLLYFGGDSVVIRFVPELQPEQRLSFLISYCLIIFAVAGSCLGTAAAWPRFLHYLFGDRGGVNFQFQMLCLSPLYVVFALVVAAHKALLEIRWAHTLLRSLTVGAFLCYGILSVYCRNIFLRHSAGLIWGVYLGLTGAAAIVGLRHLLGLKEWPTRRGNVKFLLPRGFWSYLVTTEQVSVAAFLMQRLDMVLVMNFAGIGVLGKYVTVLSVAEVIRSANRFFADTLLPSLTNLLAIADRIAASEVVSVNLRMLFLVNLLGIGTMVVLIGPMIRIFGFNYASLRPAFILAVLFSGLAAPGTLGGILLSSIGKQSQAFWICLGQVAGFVALAALFFTFSQWHLTSVIVANGMSTFCASLLLLFVGRRAAKLEIPIARDYALFIAAVCMAGLPGLWFHNAVLMLPIWTASTAMFLVLARYSTEECKALLALFSVFPLASSARSAEFC